MEMQKITLELTPEESLCLTTEMNNILMEFGIEPNGGRRFTNPVMAKAFNKVFKALTGQNHRNCEPYNMQIMEDFHNGTTR